MSEYKTLIQLIASGDTRGFEEKFADFDCSEDNGFRLLRAAVRHGQPRVLWALMVEMDNIKFNDDGLNETMLHMSAVEQGYEGYFSRKFTDTILHVAMRCKAKKKKQAKVYQEMIKMILHAAPQCCWLDCMRGDPFELAKDYGSGFKMIARWIRWEQTHPY